MIFEVEKRFGRISAGRAVLKAPRGDHRTGGLFEINVHLALQARRGPRPAR